MQIFLTLKYSRKEGKFRMKKIKQIVERVRGGGVLS